MVGYFCYESRNYIANFGQNYPTSKDCRLEKKEHRIEEVLSDWLEGVFQEKFADQMSDDEILALAKIQISPDEQERLSELLFKNREIGLNKNEQRELDLMIEMSERNMLRKSEALRVAVQRGLIKPLS